MPLGLGGSRNPLVEELRVEGRPAAVAKQVGDGTSVQAADDSEVPGWLRVEIAVKAHRDHGARSPSPPLGGGVASGLEAGLGGCSVPRRSCSARTIFSRSVTSSSRAAASQARRAARKVLKVRPSSIVRPFLVGQGAWRKTVAHWAGCRIAASTRPGSDSVCPSCASHGSEPWRCSPWGAGVSWQDGVHGRSILPHPLSETLGPLRRHDRPGCLPLRLSTLAGCGGTGQRGPTSC